MEKIAFISGETIYYWSSIVLTLATLTAICFFWSLYLGRGGNGIAAFSVVPLAIALSLLLGRLVHWYCRTSSYDSFEAAMKPFSPGGYALLGVFAGCVLAAVVIRLLHFDRNLPQMLDCMAVAGCAGIAVGRLACFFNSTDRGQIITSTQSLPWVYPVTNAVSGATEYRLATFILQAMAALVLFLILLSFYLPKKQQKDGDTALIFLLLYGVSQIVLDSTRYDKLFFRSNGFVSVVQVLGALGLLLVIVVFSARMVKARGFRFWNVLVWLGIAACIGGAGFMEYYVQRHGDLAAFSYSIMSACLLAAAGLVLLLRKLAATRPAQTITGFSTKTSVCTNGHTEVFAVLCRGALFRLLPGDLLSCPVVDLCLELLHIGGKLYVFLAVGQLQVILKGQPCGNIRLVVLDHRFHFIQRLVDFRFLCLHGVHLGEQRRPFLPGVLREGVHPIQQDVVLFPGIGVGFLKGRDVPGEGFSHVVDQAHANHLVHVRSGNSFVRSIAIREIRQLCSATLSRRPEEV